MQFRMVSEFRQWNAGFAKMVAFKCDAAYQSPGRFAGSQSERAGPRPGRLSVAIGPADKPALGKIDRFVSVLRGPGIQQTDKRSESQRTWMPVENFIEFLPK